MNKSKHYYQEVEIVSTKNKKIKTRTLAIALILVLGMTGLLQGCKANPLAKDGGGQEKKLVQEVFLPMTQVKTLNPVASNDEDTYFISKLVYEGLFVLDENMTPQTALAKDYSVDREAGTMTVDLVNTSWHDGTPFTSKDVIFSLKAYQRAGTNSQYSDLIDRIDVIEANGDNQIIIHFDNKERMSTNILTFPIMPHHGFDSINRALEPKSDFVPVGTGQYKCKSYSETNKLVLTPNEEFHGEKAKNAITFDILPSSATYGLLEADSLSLLISRKLDRQMELTKKSTKIVDFPSNQVEFLGFNTKKGSAAEPDVRKAIALAIDNDRIIEESYYGSGITNENIFFPKYLGVKPKGDVYKYDLDKSAELLKKNHYKMGDDGYLTKDGKILEIVALVNNQHGERVNAMAIIEESLKKLGIKVTIKELDMTDYLNSLEAGAFDIFFGGYQFDEQMDMRTVLGNLPENYTGFRNDELNSLLRDLYSGQKPAELKKTYENIRPILEEQLPYYCILYKTYGAIKAKSLKGEINPVWNNYYRDCKGWYSEYTMEKTEKKETDKKEKDKKGE